MKKIPLCFALAVSVLFACALEEISLPTQEPPATGTAQPTQIIFPAETVDPENARKLVKYLLETDIGCELPCWWGIIPGRTPWVEARRILEKTSLGIETLESEADFYASVKVYLPYPSDFAPYMEHLYGVKSGVVDYIRVYNFDLAPQYDLNQFLQTYGPPTGVWIRTFAKEERGIQDYLLDLFYADRGILIEYRTGEPLKEIDGKLQNCLIKDMDAPVIHLWSADRQTLSFEEAKFFIDRANLPEPQPLLEATGMDVETFYETFKDPETEVCLETPKDLWP
ncbi:MAG: hypothetical protein JW730_16815 [Anaerolineales bacterium]|nr:hypothetical protein [Anaerolineales bacterium]